MEIIGALLVLIYGLTQLVMGYVWFEDILQIPTIPLWFLIGFLIVSRIVFPFSIGAYFAAIEVWGFEWWQAALFAFPGLAIAAIAFLGVMTDSVLNYKSWDFLSSKKQFSHSESENRVIESSASLSDDYNPELKHFYEQALKEVEEESTDMEVWAEAFASTDTLDETQHSYVKLRARNLHETFFETQRHAERRDQAEIENKLRAEEIANKQNEIERLQSGLIKHEIDYARIKEQFNYTCIIIGLSFGGILLFISSSIASLLLFMIILGMLYLGILGFKLIRIGSAIKPSVNSIKKLREEIEERTLR